MIVWALLLLASAFLAALFGFTGITLEAAGVVKIVFLITLTASGVTYFLSRGQRV